MTTGEHIQGARSLPDEYAGLRDPSGPGVLSLVARRWGNRSEGDRRELAQLLMIVLESLNEPGAHVTEDLRDACEEIVSAWVDKTADSAREGAAPESPPAIKSRRVRLVHAAGEPLPDGRWSAYVTLQVGARRHAGEETGTSDILGQLTTAARAALEALRKAVPVAPHLELRKVETFEAFDSLGVIVAVRMTEGDDQSTVVGVCTNVGAEPVRAAAIAVLNATNRRLGTG